MIVDVVPHLGLHAEVYTRFEFRIVWHYACDDDIDRIVIKSCTTIVIFADK
jgi:hypothetical protein